MRPDCFWTGSTSWENKSTSNGRKSLIGARSSLTRLLGRGSVALVSASLGLVQWICFCLSTRALTTSASKTSSGSTPSGRKRQNWSREKEKLRTGGSMWKKHGRAAEGLSRAYLASAHPVGAKELEEGDRRCRPLGPSKQRYTRSRAQKYSICIQYTVDYTMICDPCSTFHMCVLQA